MAERSAPTDGLPIPPPPPPGTLDFNSRAPLDPSWPLTTLPNDELRRDLGPPSAAPLPDIALKGGPLVRWDGNVREMDRYQQSGTIKVDGDTITQQLGRGGKTAEYSLSQLAAHSKDPELFEATIRYAAEHGDSVKIDGHKGGTFVRDPALEARLPHDFPFRDIVMRAAVTHGLDPRILGAVGMQESGMGKGAGYDPVTKLGADGTGHGMWQMDEGYHSMADCIRAGNDVTFAANKAAENLAGNIAQNGRDMSIQLYNGGDKTMPYTHLIDGRMATIDNQVQQQSLEHQHHR